MTMMDDDDGAGVIRVLLLYPYALVGAGLGERWGDWREGRKCGPPRATAHCSSTAQHAWSWREGTPAAPYSTPALLHSTQQSTFRFQAYHTVP